MTLVRLRRRAVTVAAAALLTWAGAPRSNAQVLPGLTPVDGLTGPDGVQFVGPKVGQVATVIGPTIIGGTIDTPIRVGPGAHSGD